MKLEYYLGIACILIIIGFIIYNRLTQEKTTEKNNHGNTGGSGRQTTDDSNRFVEKE